MKYGWVSKYKGISKCQMCRAEQGVDGEQGTENPNLQWMVGGKSQWKTKWEADVWHNIAYEIVRDAD